MEFSLNNDVYKETIFKGYYITKTGDVAQIKFENNKLKSFFLMKKEETKDGYYRVEINKKHYFIHRLVYQTWSGERLNPELVIDHIDANRKNNYISNLRQIPQAANIQNAVCHGNFGHNHNTKIKVYDDVLNTEKIYESIKDFYIDIKAPQYIINHGGLNGLNKRTEYKRYHVTKINEH